MQEMVSVLTKVSLRESSVKPNGLLWKEKHKTQSDHSLKIMSSVLADVPPFQQDSGNSVWMFLFDLGDRQTNSNDHRA